MSIYLINEIKKINNTVKRISIESFYNKKRKPPHSFVPNQIIYVIHPVYLNKIKSVFYFLDKTKKLICSITEEEQIDFILNNFIIEIPKIINFNYILQTLFIIDSDNLHVIDFKNKLKNQSEEDIKKNAITSIIKDIDRKFPQKAIIELYNRIDLTILKKLFYDKISENDYLNKDIFIKSIINKKLYYKSININNDITIYKCKKHNFSNSVLYFKQSTVDRNINFILIQRINFNSTKYNSINNIIKNLKNNLEELNTNSLFLKSNSKIIIDFFNLLYNTNIAYYILKINSKKELLLINKLNNALIEYNNNTINEHFLTIFKKYIINESKNLRTLISFKEFKLALPYSKLRQQTIDNQIFYEFINESVKFLNFKKIRLSFDNNLLLMLLFIKQSIEYVAFLNKLNEFEIKTNINILENM